MKIMLIKRTVLVFFYLIVIFYTLKAQWVEQSPLFYQFPINYWNAQFLNRDTGFVLSDIVIAKTENGGQTWRDIDSFRKLKYPLLDFFILNEKIIFVANWTHNTFKTIDGGTTWQEIKISTDSSNQLSGPILFINSEVGFIRVGNSLYKTINQGKDWYIVLKNEIPLNLFNNIEFIPPSTIIVSEQTRTKVYHQSDDLGETWQSYKLDDETYITSIEFLNDKIGFISDANLNLIKTIDGGATWKNIYYQFSNQISKILFINNRQGFISTLDGKIYYTKDQGETWTLDYSNDSEDYIYTLAAYENVVYAVGENELVLRNEVDLSDTIPDTPEPERVLDINMYPNPLNPKIENLKIEFKLATYVESIMIYDYLQRSVFTKALNEITDTIHTQLPYLANGLYFIKIRTFEQQITKPLVIVK